MSVRDTVRITDRSKFLERPHLLREISSEMNFEVDDVKTLIEDLKDTFYTMKVAVGLAAPQIGLLKRAVIINLDKSTRETELIIINPQIIQISEITKAGKESCMSLPNWRGVVQRPTMVEIYYQNTANEGVSLVAEGFLARVIQHEIDHLNGILFVDRMDAPEDLEQVDFYNRDNYAFLSEAEEKHFLQATEPKSVIKDVD
jgi:peptide deformylase